MGNTADSRMLGNPANCQLTFWTADIVIRVLPNLCGRTYIECTPYCSIFCESGHAIAFGPACSVGDILGCGVGRRTFLNTIIRFTKNGKKVSYSSHACCSITNIVNATVTLVE